MVDHVNQYLVVVFDVFVLLALLELVVNLPVVNFTNQFKKYFIYFQGISGTTGSPGSIACQTNPCLNGGSCQSVPGGGYRCICSTSFTGTRCEFAGGNFYKPIEKIFHLFF
jgi:hypothetical protein